MRFYILFQQLDISVFANKAAQVDTLVFGNIRAGVSNLLASAMIRWYSPNDISLG